MSNLYSSKPNTKPLKGGSVSSNIGVFDTVTTTTLKLENLNIAGVFEDGILLNVIIQDSEIKNTVIGIDGPNVGYFTELQTRSDVTFLSNVPGAAVSWDPDTGLFYISSTFKVSGCSELGNIEICNNSITSTNPNGDIILDPDGFGSVYINAPVYNSSSIGSFYSEFSQGGMSFVVDDDIVMYSSHGSASLTTFNDQTLSTINGDLTLSVDQGRTSVVISQVQYSGGNISISTSLANHLQPGDVITVTGNSLANGNFTVGSIMSDTKFTVTTTTNSTTTGTGGTFVKSASNNIILDSSAYVKIPADTKLTFGATCNSVSGNTQNLLITSCGDVIFSLPTTNKIQIPQTTKFQLGTSGNNYINFDGTSVNLASYNKFQVTGSITQIDTTNTRLYDPILTLADYSLASNDGKDRGVEFRYFDSVSNSMKLGWFGYRDSSRSFTFIPDATNNNEVISGSAGNIELSGLNVNNISVAGGTIDLACGKILNASLITGCSNNLTLAGSTNVTVNATNRISLAAATDILVPNNIPVKYGTNGSYISETTSSNLVLSSSKNIQLLTQTNGSISIPIGTLLSFDGTSVGSQKLSSNTTGDLLINTNKNLYLTTTGGNIIIPSDTLLVFGASSQNVSGNTSGLRLLSSSANSSLSLISNSNVNVSSSTGNVVISTVGGDVNLYPTSGKVRIPGQIPLVFSATGTTNSVQVNSIGNFVVTGNSTNNLDATSFNQINLTASSSVNIPTMTKLNIGSDGNKFIYSDTLNTTYLTNQSTNGSFVMSASVTDIRNTGGTLNVVNNNTLITTSSFVVTGTAGSTATINSENLKIQDPIVTIGDYIPLANDLKDRGIEYRYHDRSSGSTKLGWFGMKNTTGRMTFYSDAVNSGEIISGTIGSLEVTDAYIRNNIVFATRGNLDLSCGAVNNVNTINGCGGVLNLNGENTVNISGTDVNINATSKVNIPFTTKLVFGASANAVSCDSSGTMTISAAKTLVIDSNVQINGTTTTVYSTVTNIQDPIFSIGGVTGPITNDAKDRGIEFKWNDGAVTKVGYFGYKSDSGRFVFIRDGVNNNEVFTGPYSDVQFRDAYLSNINLQNGSITGVQELSGGQLTIKTTSGNINITPTNGSSTLLPYNSTLGFGSTTNGIRSDTSGNMFYNSSGGTTIQAQGGPINILTTDSIRLPQNVPLYFGTDNSTYLIRDTSNNLLVENSSGNIDLVPKYSTGNVNIPTYTMLAFGSTNNAIYSDGSQLLLNGYNGISITSSTVNIQGNINVIGTLSAGTTDFDLNKYILPLGTYQIRNITSIQNTVSSGNFKITLDEPHYFTAGDTVILKNTDCTPILDGEYVVVSVINSTEFTVSSGTVSTLTKTGTTGTVKSNLMSQQGKDVGIQVNYWSTTGAPSATSGSLAYKTGFFGFKNSTERWSFYNNATISNNVVSGTLSDIEVNKVFANRLSGVVMDGGISAGSNMISGTNFQVSGGNINNTPIGTNVASTGRFTTLSNTVQASFTAVTLQSTLAYSFERYTLSSAGLTIRNPSSSFVVSMFSVTGPNFTTPSGTMPTVSVADGTFKVLVCSSMGEGCAYTVHFGTGKLITPNPLNISSQPTKLVFKRQSQSAQLIFDGVQGAWVLLSSGCYVT
jgi:hypothetical protein